MEQKNDAGLELILTGDFNRWDSLWGGNLIAAHSLQGEAEPLLDLMSKLNLQSLLPRGTVTYSARSVSSTIDLIFATARLAEEIDVCQVYECNHGSDHEAVHLRFSVTMSAPLSTPWLMFKSAPWAKISSEIKDGTAKIDTSPKDINEYSKQLMRIVTGAIDSHVPRAKPSPYAKRWWTESLSVLRKNYTRLRNQMSRRRRNGEAKLPQLDAQAWVAKSVYFKAVCEQKKKHWENFLEDNENIWQALKYLSNGTGTAGFASISGLKTPEDQLVDKNSEIATTLLSKFFPPLPPYLRPEKETCYNQLSTPAITENDIQSAIFQASPLKGPGCDRIPALVWQKTWPVLKGYSVPLIQSSLRQGKLPNAWKIAKILPLKKPNKGNYALPWKTSAYPPFANFE